MLCLSFIFSILLINRSQWFSESDLCFQNIICTNIFSCVAANCSNIHELLHISHHFTQRLFISEWNQSLFKCFFSMFIIFFFCCWALAGNFHAIAQVHSVSHDSESTMQHQSKSTARQKKLHLTFSKLCLDLIRIWRPLCSIAFSNKRLEELSLCSISMFCSFYDVRNSITHNFVSYIKLFVWIQFSCLQEINSFKRIFCIQWLYVASKQCSRFSIWRNSMFVSWIFVQCSFFIV